MNQQLQHKNYTNESKISNIIIKIIIIYNIKIILNINNIIFK